jgi:hypothetical protein
MGFLGFLGLFKWAGVRGPNLDMALQAMLVNNLNGAELNLVGPVLHFRALPT